jgi:plastocyanin
MLIFLDRLVEINKRSVGAIAVIVIALAAIILFVVPITGTTPPTITRGTTGPTNDVGTTTANSTDNAQGRVAVGGGNLTVSLDQFFPSTVETQTGQSVTFYAPNGATELHNVVIDLSGGSAISSVELGFILPTGFSTDALELAPPDNFGEPIIQNMSDGRQAIVALNKVLFHPSAVGQDGDATFLQEQELAQQMQQGAQQGSSMPSLSANYTMQGTEVIVSSGLMLDLMGFAPLQQGATSEQPGQTEQQQQQQEAPPQQGTNGEEILPPAYPILSNFTVTFNEPGAYPFFCAFHPGMVGIVNVVDAAATQNQT